MTTVPLAYAIYEDSNQIAGSGAKEVTVDGATYYRVQFSVVGVQPINLFEACQLYCAKCNQAFSYRTLSQGDNVIFDSSTKFNCTQCETQQLEAIFMIQMLAQDSSLSEPRKPQDDTEESKERFDDLVRVILYTHGGLCNKFFNGIQPSNLYRDNTTRVMVERYIRQICRFNVFVDAIVTR